MLGPQFFCAHTLSSLRQYPDSSVSETKKYAIFHPQLHVDQTAVQFDPGRSRDD
jgi:hypothetical protein